VYGQVFMCGLEEGSSTARGGIARYAKGIGGYGSGVKCRMILGR